MIVATDIEGVYAMVDDDIVTRDEINEAARQLLAEGEKSSSLSMAEEFRSKGFVLLKRITEEVLPYSEYFPSKYSLMKRIAYIKE